MVMFLGTTPVFTAGTFVGNKYVAYETTLYANVLMPHGISIVDPITGERESKTTFSKTAPIPHIRRNDLRSEDRKDIRNAL